MRLRQVKAGSEVERGLTIEAYLDGSPGVTRYFGRRIGFDNAVMIYLIADFGDESLNHLYRVSGLLSKLRGSGCGCGRYAEFLFFWEEFPSGEFLMEWSNRREILALDASLRLASSLLRELIQCYEQGIRHCRITPESVLLREVSGRRLELRLMGVGISQSLTPSMRCNLDWGEYSFDLEGMSEVAVDIYGIGVILLLLVCGESGLEEFESSGELPAVFRRGILSQAMERALSLRVDAYHTLLEFSQDLEAAYLDVDSGQNEVFIGDLVGFQSAVESVRGAGAVKEVSGEWSALIDDLGETERSSLLSSLTSLKAIAAVSAVDEDFDDDEETKVGPLPAAVLKLQRMRNRDDARASETESGDSEFDSCPTRIMSRSNYVAVKSTPGESGVVSAINAVLNDVSPGPISSLSQRIDSLEIITREYILGHAYYYPSDGREIMQQVSELDAQSHMDTLETESVALDATVKISRDDISGYEKKSARRSSASDMLVSDANFMDISEYEYQLKQRKRVLSMIFIAILIVVFVFAIIILRGME